jgi:hypothetical protein
MIKDKVFLFFLFLFTPLGLFVIYRVIFPFDWCINFISSNPSYKAIDVVYWHMLYLFILFIGVLFVFRTFIVIQKSTLRKSLNENYISKPSFPFIPVFTIILILLLAPIPLFHEGGSDATLLAYQDPNTKSASWLVSGILSTLSLPLYFLVFYEKNFRRKILYIVLLIICAISDGKKAGFLEFILDMLLVAGFTLNLGKRITFKYIALFIVVLMGAFFFAIYQYFKTTNKSVSLNELANSFSIMIDLAYLSFCSYLDQIHVLNGLDLIEIYHRQLGNHNIINYFFNSYIKMLGLPGGIKKSIGPFLNYWLYGSDRPNGVNPIFFYELIFITGNKYYGIVAIFILPVIFYFIIIYYRLLAYIKRVDIYKMAIYLFMIKFLTGFLTDTLNAIRSLPFLALLVVIYFLSKVKFSKSAI